MMATLMTNPLAALRRSLRVWLLALSVLAASLVTVAPVARAASSGDEEATPDARLEGYKDSVWIKEGGTAGTVVFMFILLGITFGVMFINAKRSHLD